MVGDHPGGERGFPGPLSQTLHRFPPGSHAVMTRYHRQSDDDDDEDGSSGGGIQKRHRTTTTAAAGKDNATTSKVAIPSSSYAR